MNNLQLTCLALLSSLSLASCELQEEDAWGDAELRAKPAGPKPTADNFGDGYNVHLAAVVRFPAVPEGGDVGAGRAAFGLAPDNITPDPTQALFEGESASAGLVASNGRTCFTCHRGLTDSFGLPPPPLSDHIDLSDPLFTGIEADAQGDPDALHNLDQLGLVKYRVNRFDHRPNLRPGFAAVFAWRKSPQLLNIGLQQGMLNDLRGRNLFAADRGAAFAHTQANDFPFDDLFTVDIAKDLNAFQFTLFTDPILADLRDPDSEHYEPLINDPYYTVAMTTDAEYAGRDVFDKYCFACHNTPNVFSGLENVAPEAGGQRPIEAVAWAPSVGKAYNVGVAEWNRHGLRFTEFVGPGPDDRVPIVLELAKEDGSIVEHTVETDIGLAMTTGRYVDIGRFKVPHLRNLVAKAPFFHDNSVSTIAEVVDYFNSPQYNNSADGRKLPIHLSPQERQDLIAFLYKL